MQCKYSNFYSFYKFYSAILSTINTFFNQKTYYTIQRKELFLKKHHHLVQVTQYYQMCYETISTIMKKYTHAWLAFMLSVTIRAKKSEKSDRLIKKFARAIC